MIVFEHPGMLVTWDDAIKAVVIEFRDYIEGGDFKAGAYSALNLLEERRAHKVLTDARAMRAVTQEDQRWIDMEWQPKARAAGLTHDAVVMPKSAIAKMSLTAVLKRFPAGAVEFSYFSSIEEAKAWLHAK